MISQQEQDERAAEMKWLASRFESVNQAAFARDHHVPGGASMVTQHIKGTRPMSLEAALCYASGFGVSLAEVSPRLDRFLRAAIEKMAAPPKSTPPAVAQVGVPEAMAVIGSAMASLPESTRKELGDELKLWADYGGKEKHMQAALSTIQSPGASSEKDQAAA